MSIHFTDDLAHRWGEEYAKRKGRVFTKQPEAPDTIERTAHPDLSKVQWLLGEMEPILDPHTGLAKWPLSFKRIEKDTKRPNKGKSSPDATKPGDAKPEQPPTAA